jgi:arylsulfatase A-like enzyme
LISSVALASALTGSWRAFGMWSSEGWSETGDGWLFWLTWASDPGGRRLMFAAALAFSVVILATFTKSNRSAPLRAFHAAFDFVGKPVICVVCVALALMPQAVSRVLAPNTEDKPTVVFILLDSLRLDHVGWGGSELETSPRLDALARGGAAFTQTITQAPWTKPSVGTLMTSQVPTAHEATTRTTFLNPKMRTVGESFASGGYRTLALSSNPNITPVFGFAPGFQFFVHDATSTAEPLITTAKEWLAASDHASFLYLHLNDAHYPYDPAPKYAGMFNQTGIEAHLDGPAETAFRNQEVDSFTPEQVESLRLSYAEEIRYLDDQVGEFVETLLAERDDILVVIVSDHGEEFLDHGDLGHGHSLHDELILVPLQFAWSSALGEKMGWSFGSHDEQVRHLDVLPTLLDAAGLDWPEGALPMAGESLTPFFVKSAELQHRPAFSETDHLGSPLSGPSGALRAFRNDGYKMIVSAMWQEELSPKRGWLFRLAADPGERHNIAKEQRALFDEMRARMNADGWILERDMNALVSAELSAAENVTLSEMGYAEGGPDLGGPENTYLDPKAIPWIELED